MGWLDKFFKGNRKENDDSLRDLSGMHPLERFVFHFSREGGKFLMAKSLDDAVKFLNFILKEENKKNYWSPDGDIIREFADRVPVNEARKPVEGEIFLSYVEYLIENIGGILFTSYNTGDLRLNDLPHTMVFVGTVKQLLPDVETAMEKVNLEYREAYPNVFTIHTYSEEPGNDFNKNVYLILLV
jgi:L-lactate utilization protein LutB